jgi:hypothetical protein
MSNSNITANHLINILRTPGRSIPDGEKNPLANRKESFIFRTGIVTAIDERKQELLALPMETISSNEVIDLSNIFDISSTKDV